MYTDWEPARPSANSSSTTTKQSSAAPTTISVWRSILVANEWAELQVTHDIIGLPTITTNTQIYSCPIYE